MPGPGHLLQPVLRLLLLLLLLLLPAPWLLQCQGQGEQLLQLLRQGQEEWLLLANKYSCCSSSNENKESSCAGGIANKGSRCCLCSLDTLDAYAAALQPGCAVGNLQSCSLSWSIHAADATASAHSPAQSCCSPKGTGRCWRAASRWCRSRDGADARTGAPRSSHSSRVQEVRLLIA